MDELFDWIRAAGGHVHPSLRARADPVFGGTSVFASSAIHAGEEAVRCPARLVITEPLARRAVLSCINGVEAEADEESAKRQEVPDPQLEKETQWIAAYIVLHWALAGDDLSALDALPPSLLHTPYIRILPTRVFLPASIFWSSAELALIEGSNLWHATRARRAELEAEWAVVRDAVCVGGLEGYREGFAVERYLLAATYLSSRAFPSSLVDGASSALTAAYPVLIPGVDAFNHDLHPQGVYKMEEIDRVKAVVEAGAGGDAAQSGKNQRDPLVVFQRDVQADEQVFISYGEKSNESYILAYGFVPADNPHDDVVLKLRGVAAGGGGASSPDSVPSRLAARDLSLDERHIIGTDGVAPERLWRVLRVVCGSTDGAQGDPETEMDASDTLRELLESKMASLQRLVERSEAAEGQVGAAGPQAVRQEVYEMCQVYLSGQLEILVKAHEAVMDKMDRIEEELNAADP